MKDPIIEEVRRARQEHALRFGNDLDAIFEDIKRHEAICGHPVVRFPPRKLESRNRLQPRKLPTTKHAESHIR